MKKTMRKIGKWFLIICGIWVTFLTCDMMANYIDYRNNGFSHDMAIEWAQKTTEDNWMKPVNDWLDSLKSKESEVLEFPMIIQSIQGNTLINEYKSGR